MHCAPSSGAMSWWSVRVTVPPMTLRKRMARWAIDTWDRLRDRPLGRGIQRLRDAIDPAVYLVWYVVTWRRARRPRTFNEKLMYKMLYDRRPILTRIADKVAVRDIVASRIGERYLTTVYQVCDDPARVRWSSLPREFVAKVTHASGGAIICSEAAAPGQALPERLVPGHGRLVVHPDAFDADRATAIMTKWWSMRYGWSGMKREWAYLHVPARVLVEECLSGSRSGIPEDYKFMVLSGRCRWIQVDVGRYEEHRRDIFTRDWERLPVDYEYPRSDDPVTAPDRLDEMIELAERLGQGHDFVRVDLYALEGRIVFGELTAYPEAAEGTFVPGEFDELLGAGWAVPRRYE